MSVRRYVFSTFSLDFRIVCDVAVLTYGGVAPSHRSVKPGLSTTPRCDVQIPAVGVLVDWLYSVLNIPQDAAASFFDFLCG